MLEYRGIILCYGLNVETARHQYAVGWKQKSIHAEFRVIQRFKHLFALTDLSRFDLFLTRITRLNEIKSSKPCKPCQNLLEVYRPKNIFFTNEVGEFEKL